jgi:glycosyltransferase involved in cell wall biosynthesis
MNSCTVAYAFYETDFRIKRYADALSGPGVRTDAIALQSESTEKFEIMNHVNVHRIQKRNFDGQGGPFDYLLKMGLFFVKSSVIVLYNHLRYRYDIIIVHNVPDFFVFTALVPKLLGAKVMLDIHDILPEFFCQRFHKPLNSVYGSLLRITEYLSVKFCDFVITGNEIWRNKISKRDHFPLERMVAFVNYPHLEYFRGINHRVRDNGLSIVYPGHLSHHHGIDIAIRAMPLIRKEIPEAALEIYAGSWVPQYRSELEKMITDLNLDVAVRIHRPRDIHELVEVYKKTDIGLVPKRGGFFASEAFSSKILDFMASGIPIVASRTTIDEYYFNDSQIMFFEADNVADCARSILSLYRDPKKRKQLSENGLRYAAENNWDIKKKVFLDAVNSIVKE